MLASLTTKLGDDGFNDFLDDFLTDVTDIGIGCGDSYTTGLDSTAHAIEASKIGRPDFTAFSGTFSETFLSLASLRASRIGDWKSSRMFGRTAAKKGTKF